MTAQASNTGPLICRLIRMPNDPLGQINRNNPHPCLSSLLAWKTKAGGSRLSVEEATHYLGTQRENTDAGVMQKARPLHTVLWSLCVWQAKGAHGGQPVLSSFTEALPSLHQSLA